MTLIWLIGVFALFTSPLSAQEGKEVRVKDAIVTELLSTTMTSSGQAIVLPQKDVQIVVSIYDVMPGVTLQVQNHPYPRYGYVLSGNLRVDNIDTGQTETYKPGSFILESVGLWHKSTSIGREPLKLLVIDIVKKGQPNTVLLN
jgi:quercetin dioxygenase-like cupin family protein